MRFCRSHFERILLNRFYLGYFDWEGIEYKGTHAPLISVSLFNVVQHVLSGRNKPKKRKHDFAFAGLLTCAHDGCTVTSELQKAKYVYYRCSHGRGKCSLPYMREQDLSDKLGEVFKEMCVPESVAGKIVGALEADSHRAESERQERVAGTQQRLSALRTRMDQMYEDKLDGKIDEAFFTRKMTEWREQERTLTDSLVSISGPITSQSILSVKRIFELAERTHYLYFTRNHMERAELLKSVLLNCTTDGVSLWPTYRKPFDLPVHK
jgi:site-specific DNA recombinase